jgi:hypothetical protein
MTEKDLADREQSSSSGSRAVRVEGRKELTDTDHVDGDFFW